MLRLESVDEMYSKFSFQSEEPLNHNSFQSEEPLKHFNTSNFWMSTTSMLVWSLEYDALLAYLDMKTIALSNSE